MRVSYPEGLILSRMILESALELGGQRFPEGVDLLSLLEYINALLTRSISGCESSKKGLRNYMLPKNCYGEQRGSERQSLNYQLRPRLLNC